MDRILIVDDDSALLSLMTRQLRDHFEVATAGSAAAALQVLVDSPQYAVIVSDLEMPGASGNDFLAEVRAKYPASIRIMLTGHGNLEAAIQAINEGSVFRFLTKPCEAATLRNVLQAGVDQYRLQQSEKELLEKTLSGSVKLLSDILSMSSPVAFGRVARIRRTVRRLAGQLRAESPWLLELGAMLSHTGCIAIPQDILSKAVNGKELNQQEQEIYSAYPQHGHDLMCNIPRLVEVAKIVKYQLKNYDGSGFPNDELGGESLPVGSRLMRVALEYDTLSARGKTGTIAMLEMKRNSHLFWPSAFGALQEVVEGEAGFALRTINVSELAEGMLIAEDVFTPDGTLLASRGFEVTASLKVRLQMLGEKSPARQQLRVQMPMRVGA